MRTQSAILVTATIAFRNMHGATVDPEGNLYVAEVGNRRRQKFTRPRGARPELLVGKPPVLRS